MRKMLAVMNDRKWIVDNFEAHCIEWNEWANESVCLVSCHLSASYCFNFNVFKMHEKAKTTENWFHHNQTHIDWWDQAQFKSHMLMGLMHS